MPPTLKGSVNFSAAATVTIPAHAIGDTIVIAAYRNASTTPPSTPAASGTVPAWSVVDAPTGANTNSMKTAIFVATATNHTSGTWTNATQMVAFVIQGATSTPLGGHTQGGTANSTGVIDLNTGAVTLAVTNGSSMILRIVFAKTVTAWGSVPSGWTSLGSSTTSVVEVLSKTVTTSEDISGDSQTNTFSANGGFRVQGIELKGVAAPITVTQPAASVTASRTTQPSWVATSLASATASRAMKAAFAPTAKATATFSRTTKVALAPTGKGTANFSARVVLPNLWIALNGLFKDFDPGDINSLVELHIDPVSKDWKANTYHASPQGFQGADTIQAADAISLGMPSDSGIPTNGTDRGTWVSGTTYSKYDKVIDPTDGLQYVARLASPSTTVQPHLSTSWVLATWTGFSPRSLDSGFYGSVRATGDATRWFSTEVHALGNAGASEPTGIANGAAGLDGTNYVTRRTTYRGAWTASTAYAVNDYVLADGSLWRNSSAGTSGATTPSFVTGAYGDSVADGPDCFWTRRYIYAGAWSSGKQYGARVVNSKADVRGEALILSDNSMVNWLSTTPTEGQTGSTEPAWSAAAAGEFYADGTLIWRFGTFAVNDPTLQAERLVLSGLTAPATDGKLVKITNSGTGNVDVVLADKAVLNRIGTANLTGTDKESVHKFDFGGAGKNVRLAPGQSFTVRYDATSGNWLVPSVVITTPPASLTASRITKVVETAQLGKRRAEVKADADWILTSITPEGAIAQYPDSPLSRINPYISHFAAIGLVKAYRLTRDASYITAVWNWLDWYSSKMDTSGYVTDYNLSFSAGTYTYTSTGDEDSTDSYAALFLVAIREAWRATHNATKLATYATAISKAVSAIQSTQDTDGLTWAKPTYHMKYLMDAAEVSQGLQAAIEITTVLGDHATLATANSMLSAHSGGFANFWNSSNSNWDVSISDVGVHTPASWGTFYPDSVAQAWPIAFDALFDFISGQPSATSQMATLESNWPNWDDASAVNYWGMVAVAYEKIGNYTRALTGRDKMRAYSISAGRAWDYTPGKAGQLIQATPDYVGTFTADALQRVAFVVTGKGTSTFSAVQSVRVPIVVSGVASLISNTTVRVVETATSRATVTASRTTKVARVATSRANFTAFSIPIGIKLKEVLTQPSARISPASPTRAAFAITMPRPLVTLSRTAKVAEAVTTRASVTASSSVRTTWALAGRGTVTFNANQVVTGSQVTTMRGTVNVSAITTTHEKITQPSGRISTSSVQTTKFAPRAVGSVQLTSPATVGQSLKSRASIAASAVERASFTIAGRGSTTFSARQTTTGHQFTTTFATVNFAAATKARRTYTTPAANFVLGAGTLKLKMTAMTNGSFTVFASQRVILTAKSPVSSVVLSNATRVGLNASSVATVNFRVSFWRFTKPVIPGDEPLSGQIPEAVLLGTEKLTAQITSAKGGDTWLLSR